MTKRTELRLQDFSDTDIGRVRSVNQDQAFSWVLNPPRRDPLALLMVADGTGGHPAGKVASELAIETIAESLVPHLEQDWSESPPPTAELVRALREAIQKANAVIHRHAQRSLGSASDMGATIAAVLVQGDQAVIANVGDSRVYLLDESGLEQLTEDHTPVGELVEEGLLDTEDVFDHPQRHILNRALGFSPMVEVDTDTLSVRAGSWLLVCSDGLWGMIRDIAKLERILERTDTPEAAVRKLIETANRFGGKDNIGVAVCKVSKVEC